MPRSASALVIFGCLAGCGGSGAASATDDAATHDARGSRDAASPPDSGEDARSPLRDARGGRDTLEGEDAEPSDATTDVRPSETDADPRDAGSDSHLLDAGSDARPRDAAPDVHRRDAGSDALRTDAAPDGPADAGHDVGQGGGPDAAVCTASCTVLAYCVDVPGTYTLLWDGTTWTQTESGPTPLREVPAMAALHDTVVLFGGSSVPSVGTPETYYADTWVWTAGAWVDANVSGPSARSGAAFASFGDELVLVGGSGGSPSSVDTWLWSGSAWSQAPVTGPSARSSSAMAALGENLVLFGGEATSGMALADTWTFDGTSWSPLAVTGPAARFYAKMVPFGDKLLLYGGWGGAGYSSAYTDTWTWDGTRWTEIATQGPPADIETNLVAFAGGALAMSPVGGEWMWWFDGSSWTELASTVPICGNGPTGEVIPATSF